MIKAIVTDIEGTTSSLSFVKDILFPYAKAHLPDYVRNNLQQAAVIDILQAVQTISGKAMEVEQIIALMQQWIEQDLKHTPLKLLQGMIWENGYKQSDFTGHVYQDAYEQMLNWHKQGIKLYVYSSGSEAAQKLLFQYSDFGDISGLFSGHFDTRIGHKREASSYAKIVNTLALNPETILFLSDTVQELDAAMLAGMQVQWLKRDSANAHDSKYSGVSDFYQIKIMQI